MAVACGNCFTSTLTEHGGLWAWGKGESGVLGRGMNEDALLPVCVGGVEENPWPDVFVFVAAGIRHTACVSTGDTLWTWDGGEHSWGTATGKLDREVMVSCGNKHMVVLTCVG